MVQENTLQATVILYRRKRQEVLSFSIFTDSEMAWQKNPMICKGSQKSSTAGVAGRAVTLGIVPERVC